MRRILLRLHSWRLMPQAVVACGLLGCLLILLAPLSCRRPRPTPTPERPLETSAPLIRVRLNAVAMESATISADGPYRLSVDGFELSCDQRPMAPLTIRRTNTGWLLDETAVAGQKLTLEPLKDARLRLDNCKYRGLIVFTPLDGGFAATNHVDVESYLAGVLPKELYPLWSLETYRALAVAARSFALYHQSTFGRTHDYDVGANQSSQVYGGFSAETPKSWKAVRSTHGRVLVYGAAGQEKLIMAQYSSCCGGTVNGAYVIREAPQVPPLLGGQACQDCADSTKYRWEPVRVGKADLYRAISACYPAARPLEAVKTLQIVSSTAYGRAVWVDVLGASGQSVRLRAEDIRIAIIKAGLGQKLYSMNCQISDVGAEIEFSQGRGFGHGVGLCQWGAEGKARKGLTAEQILGFYYPQAGILRAY